MLDSSQYINKKEVSQMLSLTSTMIVAFDFLGSFTARRWGAARKEKKSIKYKGRFKGELIINQINGMIIGFTQDINKGKEAVLIGKTNLSQDFSRGYILFYKIYQGYHYFLYTLKHCKMAARNKNPKWFWRGEFCDSDWEDPEHGDAIVYLSNPRNINYNEAMATTQCNLACQKIHSPCLAVVLGAKYNLTASLLRRVSYAFGLKQEDFGDNVSEEEIQAASLQILAHMDDQIKYSATIGDI